MKKLFTILALVLTVALCASFAVSAETLSALGSTSADVNVTYNPATDDTTTVVYSVDVAWTAGTFTYNAGTNKWDPETHSYATSNRDGQWTANTEGSVTVTNHSNAAVAVTVAYAKVTGKTVEVNVENGSFGLASAVGKAVGAADAKTATFKVDTSTAPTSGGKVGEVTVTIAAPAAQG